MVKLRLKRMGEKFNAFYRIVAADARAPRDGRFIEEVGYYNPHTKELLVKTEIRTKWEKVGAIPSETVKALFKKYDAMKKPGEVVFLNKKDKTVKKEVVIEEAPVVEETKIEIEETPVAFEETTAVEEVKSETIEEE